MNPPIVTAKIHNPQLDTYTKVVDKAYSDPSLNNQQLLNKAKDQMEASEVRLLMLMMQMRGQFDKKGGFMVNSGC